MGASEPSAFVPRLVAALAGKRVRAVQAGFGHNVVLTEAGEVFTFGDGGQMQLGLSDDHGDGDTDDHYVPAAVTALAGMQVEEVAAGGAHTIVRLASGELRSFGSNTSSQLGHSEDARLYSATPRVVALPAQPPE
jgi:RCC1 and BTB domain-containing protein